MDGNSIQILHSSISPLRRFQKEEFEEEYQNPYGFIYLITNLENDKVYVGQTIKPIFDRFSNHVDASKSENPAGYLHRAIRKYGRVSFEIECLCNCSSLEELNKKERYYIKFYDSINPKKGYNITEGGNGKSSDKSKSQGDKIRGEHNGMHGTNIYERWLIKYGKKEADRRYANWIENKRGYKWTVERRKSFSKNNSGSNNHMTGRSLHDIWTEKFGKEEADRRWEEQKSKIRGRVWTDKQRVRIMRTRALKPNPMKGRCNYDIWLQKYGREEAERRKQEVSRKQKEGWASKRKLKVNQK